MYSISGIYYIRHIQKYINYVYQLIQHIHTKQCLTKPVIFCIVQINSGHPESQIIMTMLALPKVKMALVK